MQFIKIMQIVQDILLALALLVSIYFYIKNKTKAHLILMLLLIFLVGHNSIQHFYASHMSELVRQKWMAAIALFALFEIAGYSLIFAVLIKSKARKKVAYSLLTISMLVLIADIFGGGGYDLGHSTLSYVIITFNTIICIFIFQYELFLTPLSKKIFTNFWFWISTSLFIFLASEIPLMSSIKYIRQNITDDSTLFFILVSIKLILGSLYYLTYLVTPYICKFKK